MEIGACQPNQEETAAPKQRGRTILLGFLGFLLALGVLLLWAYHGISPVVYGEYGEDVPSVTAFCQKDDAFLWADESCTALGRHMVQVITRFRVVPCWLIVQDTVAPTAVPVTVDFPSGYEPTPDQFISDLKDADRVGVSFAQDYDFSPAGEQTVVIQLEDGSGNVNEVQATALVRSTVDRVTMEAGAPIPAVDPFLTEGFHGELLDTITDHMMRTPGEYVLRIQCPENKRIFTTVLAIQDTVAPAATGQLLVLAPGETAAPEAFLTDAADETALQYAFLQAPDPDSREIQNILIRVTDAGGNTADVPAQVLYSSLGRVTVEAKNGLLTGADIDRPEAEPEGFMANTLGNYPVRVRLTDGVEIALVTVVDTVAPVLTLQEKPFYTRHAYTPEELVNVTDATSVALSFVQAPDQDSDHSLSCWSLRCMQ